MASKVKQASFRLPIDALEYIDEVAEKQHISKAYVITRALECLKSSNGAEGQAGRSGESGEEAVRRALKAERERDEALLRERKALEAFRQAEDKLKAKNVSLNELEAQVVSLRSQLDAANARIQHERQSAKSGAVEVESQVAAGLQAGNPQSVLGVVGGVIGALQQQAADARLLGEQEGRANAMRTMQNAMERARTDGYRDAMNYLDDRVSGARDAGAREERARIANMGPFERRRYLRTHIV